jgi:hypothetical protein
VPVRTHKEQANAAFVDKFRLLTPEDRACVHDCVTRLLKDKLPKNTGKDELLAAARKLPPAAARDTDAEVR